MSSATATPCTGRCSGERIENTYTLKVINLDNASARLPARGQRHRPAAGGRRRPSRSGYPPGRVSNVVARLAALPAAQAAGVHRITISVTALDQTRASRCTRTARFIGPRTMNTPDPRCPGTATSGRGSSSRCCRRRSPGSLVSAYLAITHAGRGARALRPGRLTSHGRHSVTRRPLLSLRQPGCRRACALHRGATASASRCAAAAARRQPSSSSSQGLGRFYQFREAAGGGSRARGARLDGLRPRGGAGALHPRARRREPRAERAARGPALRGLRVADRKQPAARGAEFVEVCVNLGEARAQLRYDPGKLTLSSLLRALDAARLPCRGPVSFVERRAGRGTPSGAWRSSGWRWRASA